MITDEKERRLDDAIRVISRYFDGKSNPNEIRETLNNYLELDSNIEITFTPGMMYEVQTYGAIDNTKPPMTLFATPSRLINSDGEEWTHDQVITLIETGEWRLIL